MATNPTTTLPKLNIGSQPTLNMSGTPDYTSFFNPESISEQQYLGSGVDFYTQTLGTGIKSTVAEEEKPEEKVEDTKPDIFKPIGSDGGDDKQSIASEISRTLKAGLDSTQLYNASDLNPQSFSYNNKTGNVDVTSYKGGTAGKTVKQKGDLVGDFFSNFASNIGAINAEQLKGVASPFDALGKTPTLTSPTGRVSAMGVPPVALMAMGPAGTVFGALASIGGAANMAIQQQNAARIKAMGGGAFMDVNGMMVSRAPGSAMYSGNLQGMSQKQMSYVEAMQRGFVRGTMKIEQEYDADAGTWKTPVAGVRDVVSGRDIVGIGGGFTETGAWMDLAGNTSTGTVAKETEAYTDAVNKQAGLSGNYKVSKSQIMNARQNVQTSWSLTKGTHVTPGTPTYQDLIDNLTKAAQQKQQEDEMNAAERALAGTSGRDEEDMTKAEIEAEQKAIDKMIADAAKSGGGSQKDDSDKGSGGNAGGGGGDYGGGQEARDVAMGGRIGYQEGGEAGFAQRPEFVGGNQTQPDGVSVADDQPRDVQEGTFVINAAAADFAGRDDIEKMIRDAYKKVGDTGQSGVTQEIAINVSKGEVMIPPHIAKVIGYDRLNKINNRGKKEIARRQEAAGGGFIDRKKFAAGDVVLPKSKPKRVNQSALGDVELRADMEEFIQTDPLARLGWNLYEKGDLDIKAIVLPSKKEVQVNVAGVYTPRSERRDPGRISRQFEGFAEKQGITKQNRKVAGVHYITGENVNYERSDATLTLLHELRHHAMRHLNEKYKIPLPELSREEAIFDAQDHANRIQARKVKPSIPREAKEKNLEITQRQMYMSPSANKEMAMYQSVAEEVLKDRKVPPRTKSKEVEGFFTRAMGLLGL